MALFRNIGKGSFASRFRENISKMGRERERERKLPSRETRSFRQLADIQKQIQAETAPFRQAGLDLLGQFQGGPGQSQFFQQGLDVGGAQLSQQLAKFGLLDSSTSGRAFGQLTTGLLGQEEQLQQQAFQTAAGLGQTGFGQLGNLAAQQFGLTRNIPTQGVPSTAGSDIGGLLGVGLGAKFGAEGSVAAPLIGGALGAGLGSLFN